MPRQQGRVVLDGAVRGNVQDRLGHERGHVGHHAQIRPKRRHLPGGLRLAVGPRLVDGQSPLHGALLDRIRRTAFRVRCAVHADHVFSAIEQRLQHALPERLLAVNDDSHLQLSM